MSIIDNKIESVTKLSEQHSKRLLALDVARGLAVVGMYLQHFALNQRNSFVSGNTMILFILCSGISYTIMSQRMSEQGLSVTTFRSRILARSLFIDFIGYLILMLNGPFGVVLPAYAMLFVLSLALVHYSVRTLTILSGILFWVCPPLMLIGLSLLSNAALLYDIAGGPLSALAWAPVFIAGMAIGKMDLNKFGTTIKFVVIGLTILIPSKLFSLFFLSGLRHNFENWLVQFPAYSNPNLQIDPYAAWPMNTQPVQWQMLFLDYPQSGATFELLIGFGGSLILFGLLLLVEQKFRGTLKPFVAPGRVALTLYVAQFIWVWIKAISGGVFTNFNIGSIPFGDVILAVFVISLGWLFYMWHNGPLESMIRWFEGLFYKN